MDVRGNPILSYCSRGWQELGKGAGEALYSIAPSILLLLFQYVSMDGVENVLTFDSKSCSISVV